MMVQSRRYAGGSEVALPIEDLVRKAFAALSRGDLDWLQRQYLAQDIRCHFPGGAPWPGITRANLKRWSSLAGPSSSQAAHSGARCPRQRRARRHAGHGPRRTGQAWRLERHGVFISHITDGKPTEVWSKV
jgi:ketosteroid isomerase-like protein